MTGIVEAAIDSVAGRSALVVTFGSVCQPEGGMPARARLTVEALAGLGMRVSVISHPEPPDAMARMAMPGLEDLIVLDRAPHYGFSWELVRSVRALASKADVVIVESALLLPAVRAANRQVPVVWDTNECETLHYQRLAPSFSVWLRRLVWRRLEGWAAGVCQVAIAISEEEAQSWRSLFPTLRERTVWVAHRAFLQPASPWRPPDVGPDAPMLLFLGSLVGKHNLVAAEWLVTVLAPRLPAGTALVLVGPGTEALVPAARLAATVCCLGRVDDVDGLIAAADLCLAPLPAGAGVKTKVLHYLAHGKPVIGTPAAFEGITGAPGVVCVPMDGFVAEVLGAIAGLEAGRPDDWGAARREWLDSHHDVDAVSEQWAQVMASALGGAGWRRDRHPRWTHKTHVLNMTRLR